MSTVQRCGSQSGDIGAFRGSPVRVCLEPVGKLKADLVDFDDATVAWSPNDARDFPKVTRLIERIVFSYSGWRLGKFGW